MLVVVAGCLLLLLGRKFSLFPCLCLLPRPSRLPGCMGHWRGPGSCIGGLVVVWVAVPSVGHILLLFVECGRRSIGLHSCLLLLVVV